MYAYEGRSKRFDRIGIFKQEIAASFKFVIKCLLGGAFKLFKTFRYYFANRYRIINFRLPGLIYAFMQSLVSQVWSRCVCLKNLFGSQSQTDAHTNYSCSVMYKNVAKSFLD